MNDRPTTEREPTVETPYHRQGEYQFSEPYVTFNEYYEDALFMKAIDVVGARVFEEKGRFERFVPHLQYGGIGYFPEVHPSQRWALFQADDQVDVDNHAQFYEWQGDNGVPVDGRVATAEAQAASLGHNARVIVWEEDESRSHVMVALPVEGLTYQD